MSAGVSILQIGDPRLRRVAEPVSHFDAPHFHRDVARLHATLQAFREEFGFGRATAAPQIGVNQRVVALNLGEGPLTMVNPVIIWRAEASITLWDDCMSFPWLLVKLKRHASISVRFQDERGAPREWQKLDPATSELLQHEIDHLDGILAVDRAQGRDAMISRATFEAHPEWFRDQVNHP